MPRTPALDLLMLTGRQTIPMDADALIFAGNTSDLSRQETDVVRKFWEERRGGLLIFLDPAAKTPNLNSILHQNGVHPLPDRVMSQPSIAGLVSRKIYNVPVSIMPGFGPTRDLPAMDVLLKDRTQSLKVQTSDELVLSQNVRPYPLMVAAGGFWGELDFQAAEVIYDPNTENGQPNPVHTAAAIEKGESGDLQLDKGVSRLVVISNPNLISPDGNYQKTAADFCIASLNWVMKRDKLLGISPRQPTTFDLSMLPSTFGLLQTLVVWVLPTVLLFCGAWIWYRRRA